jgi:hypothetical protein
MAIYHHPETINQLGIGRIPPECDDFMVEAGCRRRYLPPLNFVPPGFTIRR